MTTSPQHAMSVVYEWNEGGMVSIEQLHVIDGYHPFFWARKIASRFVVLKPLFYEHLCVHAYWSVKKSSWATSLEL